MKIRIVLDGLRGEDSIAELCRREGISQGLYYKWSKDFMEPGKKRLAGDTARAANTDEVKELRREAKVVAEQTLELGLLKKSMTGDGGDHASLQAVPSITVSPDHTLTTPTRAGVRFKFRTFEVLRMLQRCDRENGYSPAYPRYNRYICYLMENLTGQSIYLS